MAITNEMLEHQIIDLQHEIRVLQQALYGNPKEPPNGGGVLGEVRRMRVEMRISGEKREQKVERLAIKLDEVEDRLERVFLWNRPKWWDLMIVSAVCAVFVLLLLQVFLVTRVL